MLVLACLPLMSHAENAKTEFLQMFVVGNYDIVGKAKNPEKAYYGKVNITVDNKQLLVKRHINGKEIIGKGNIETAAGGDVNVLRIRYLENNQNIEQTCLVHSDLNNYARISCYVYEEKNTAGNLGMEAWFHAEG